MEKVLLYFSIKYNGDWDKIYHALDTKEKIKYYELDEIENKIDCKYITILSPLYPSYLKNSRKPPFVIFYKGDISLLTKYKRIIGFKTGNNQKDFLSKPFKKFLTECSKEKVSLISLENKEVINDLINLCYEKQISLIVCPVTDMYSFLQEKQDIIFKENQLFISEVYKANILNSDQIKSAYKILTGVSKGVIFYKINDTKLADKIFVYLVNEGREVFAFPECWESEFYTNKYIKDGAKLIENLKDILIEI